jgi:ubiquinone/menaquinone biosynthesis C-methylase UbiE
VDPRLSRRPGGAWFAKDDLHPFLSMCSRFGSRFMRHAARRIGPSIPPSPRRAAAKAGECHAMQSGLQQAEVDWYFQSSAGYWKEIYRSRRVRALTYQQCRDVVLRWMAALGLPASARILDVGCGAGVLAADLASAGYSVDAIDTAPAMLDMTRRHASCAAVAARVNVRLGDAHALVFPDAMFDVVTAIGLLPWLHSEAVAIYEMQRVLKPGGYVLVTTDNELRLDRLLDPLSTPPLAPLRRMARALMPGAHTPKSPCGFASKRHRPTEVDGLLSRHGFIKARSMTLGFWPLTFFDREIFSDAISVRIDRFLRALAGRNFPGLQKTGSQYLVLGQKPRA